MRFRDLQTFLSSIVVAALQKIAPWVIVTESTYLVDLDYTVESSTDCLSHVGCYPQQWQDDESWLSTGVLQAS